MPLTAQKVGGSGRLVEVNIPDGVAFLCYDGEPIAVRLRLYQLPDTTTVTLRSAQLTSHVEGMADRSRAMVWMSDHPVEVEASLVGAVSECLYLTRNSPKIGLRLAEVAATLRRVQAATRAYEAQSRGVRP